MNEDPGTIAYVVALKRTDGGIPKLEKVSDGKFHLIREEAHKQWDEIPSSIRSFFEVRTVLIKFVSAE